MASGNPFETRWSNEAHEALCVALVDALVKPGSSVAAHKEAILASMISRGFNFTWEAIR